MAFWELATLASWQVALQWSCTAICPTPDRELMCVALGVGVGWWKTWALAPIFSRLLPVGSRPTPSDSGASMNPWGRAVLPFLSVVMLQLSLASFCTESQGRRGLVNRGSELSHFRNELHSA